MDKETLLIVHLGGVSDLIGPTVRGEQFRQKRVKLALDKITHMRELVKANMIKKSKNRIEEKSEKYFGIMLKFPSVFKKRFFRKRKIALSRDFEDGNINACKIAD